MYTLEEQADCLAILDEASERAPGEDSDGAAWVVQYLDWYQVDELNRRLDPFLRNRG